MNSLLDDMPNFREQIANALMQPSTADIRNTPAQRGDILPLAIYGDGSVRPAMSNGMNRLLEIMSLQRRPDPSQGDALLVGGAASVGGLAAPRRPVIPSQTVIDGYHGTRTAGRFYNGKSNAHFPNLYMTGGREASDQMLANMYANWKATPASNPAVIETQARFWNPMEIDAKGARYDNVPFNGKRVVTDDIAEYAKDKGHDGLIIRNVLDPPSEYQKALHGNTVVALKPGTVFDRYGSQIYANPSTASINALIAAALQNQE